MQGESKAVFPSLRVDVKNLSVKTLSWKRLAQNDFPVMLGMAQAVPYSWQLRTAKSGS